MSRKKKSVTKRDARESEAKAQAKRAAAKEAKRLQLAAEQALERAEQAVAAAHDAVRTARKPLQKQADKLAKQTDKLITKLARSRAEVSDQQTRADAARSRPPLTPPLPAPSAAAPTLIELRELAKEQRLVGYSRMNKATLLEHLDVPGHA